MSEFRPKTGDAVLWASVTGPLRAEFQGFHPGPDGAKYARLIVRDGRGLIAVPATEVGPMPLSPPPAPKRTTAMSDDKATPTSGDTLKTEAANARLIAAAPALLAFVRGLQAEYAAYLADDSNLYPERLLSHVTLAESLITKAAPDA